MHAFLFSLLSAETVEVLSLTSLLLQWLTYPCQKAFCKKVIFLWNMNWDGVVLFKKCSLWNNWKLYNLLSWNGKEQLARGPILFACYADGALVLPVGHTFQLLLTQLCQTVQPGPLRNRQGLHCNGQQTLTASAKTMQVPWGKQGEGEWSSDMGGEEGRSSLELKQVWWWQCLVNSNPIPMHGPPSQVDLFNV